MALWQTYESLFWEFVLVLSCMDYPLLICKDVSISETILFLLYLGIPDVRTMGDLTDVEPAVSVPNGIL